MKQSLRMALSFWAACFSSASLASARITPTQSAPHFSAVEAPLFAVPTPPGDWIRRLDRFADDAILLEEFAVRQTPLVFTEEDADPALDEARPEEPVILRENAPVRSQVFFDVQGEVHWALGTTYKASAGPLGFTYVPNFGPEAPQNYPVRMRLDAAFLGPEKIALTPRAKATREGSRFVLDRGPIDIWYDLDLDSVEQSFALNAAGSKVDLKLLLDVETGLALETRAGELAWVNALGSVTYRKAVVIDGNGSRLEIPLQREGNQVNLTVPSEFLEAAVDPIVVDPILQTYTVHPAGAQNEYAPDVAYDYSNDAFVYAFVNTYSATDRDIVVEKYTGAGAFLTFGYVDFTSANWYEPSIANDNGTDTFLVAAISQNTAGTEIWGRTVSASNLNVSPPVQIGAALAGFYSNMSPDVGGKSQGSSMFKVVWRRDFPGAPTGQIRSATVIPTSPHSTSVAPTVSAVEAVTNDGSFEFTEPAISKSSGRASNAEWRVVFCAKSTVTGADTLHGARYADDNTLLHAESGFYGTATPLLSVDVSDGLSDVPGPVNGAPTYLVACHATGTSGDRIIFMGMELDSYFEAQSTRFLEHRGLSDSEGLGMSIATSSNNFILSYIQPLYNPTRYWALQTKLDLVDGTHWGVSERRLRLGDLAALPAAPTCSASRFSGGNYNSRYVASGFGDWNGTRWNVRGQTTYQALRTLAGYQYCTGNPNSTGDYGHLIVFGDSSVSGFKALEASALPLNQFGYFLCSQGGVGNLPISNGVLCLVSTPIGRYNQPLETFFTGTTGTAFLTIGPTDYRGPSGNVSVFSGQTWNFQAWHRENGGASNLTDAVTVHLQ